ncbi:MAG: hypothetical protein KGJ57_11815 [Sphingomonadales bacterium]|nr:hypothetical protein [Sphingomonadales bacterium]MDE2170102.1 hypothetical protein [Sphingomonadales bacterium]
MNRLRAFLRLHPGLAALILCAALMMRAAVPAGFMPQFAAHSITIEICADASGLHLTRQIALPLAPGHERHDSKSESGPCAFGGMAHAMLGGVDGWLLASALAFILLLGFAPVHAPAPRRAIYLRPPLRGPPLPT